MILQHLTTLMDSDYEGVCGWDLVKGTKKIYRYIHMVLGGDFHCSTHATILAPPPQNYFFLLIIPAVLLVPCGRRPSVQAPEALDHLVPQPAS